MTLVEVGRYEGDKLYLDILSFRITYHSPICHPSARACFLASLAETIGGT